MSDNFLTRVSFAGVPHTLTHSSDLSEATIFPINAQNTCHLYWMLSSLDISYAYTINGVQVSRNFSVTSSVIPKNRLISPAIFYATGYDSSVQTSYVAELHLDKVYFNTDDKSQLGLKLTIAESDNFGIMNLALHQKSGMNNIARNFSFAGGTFVVYLNYSPTLVTSASFASFSITANFFVI
jgi:hypothetical protein